MEVGMATTITTWTSLLKPFLPIFTQPGRVIFTQLTVGWILCTVRRTVTGMLPFANPHGEQAHDAYHRFFPDARWSMAKLWQTLAFSLIRTFYRTGLITLALADTLFRRRRDLQFEIYAVYGSHRTLQLFVRMWPVFSK